MSMFDIPNSDGAWGAHTASFLGLWGYQPDMVLYTRSNVDLDMSDALVVDGKRLYLYSDAFYIIRPWKLTAYTRKTAIEEYMCFNQINNWVRTVVEWSYHELKQKLSNQYSRRSSRCVKNISCCATSRVYCNKMFGCACTKVESSIDSSKRCLLPCVSIFSDVMCALTNLFDAWIYI